MFTHHRRTKSLISCSGAAVIGLIMATTTGLAPSKAEAAPLPAAATPVVTPQTDLAQKPTSNPGVDKNGFVTFTYVSATASAVTVTGNWGPSSASTTYPLSRGSGDRWTLLLGPLDRGLYSYSLTVDGAMIVDPNNPNVVHTSPVWRNIFFVSGKGAWLLTPHKVRHGAVTDLAYESAVTGTVRHATVWTPPGYSARKAPYPTFYLYHGGGGDYLDWVQQGRANVILDNLFAQGRLKPMVVVMGDGNVPGAVGEPQNDKFVPEVLDNLIPAVEASYNVSISPRKRALAGLSLGGLQTWNMLIAKPGEFAYIGDFSSGYFPNVLTAIESSGILTTNAKAINRQTIMHRIYIGNITDIAYNNNIATRALFDKYHVRYKFAGVYADSGHFWKTWQHDLADFAPRIFRH